MMTSNLGNCKTTCTIAGFAKPAFLARPAATRRKLVCNAAQGSNETLRKLAGAAAAAQIALFPFAGSAVAQPQFDLAVDLPNPVELAQDAKGKADNALPTPGNGGAPKIDLPGPAPSLADTKKAFADVAGGGGGLKEAARGGGGNISSTRATGDISDVSGVVDKAKQAIPSNGNAAAQKDPIGDRQALVDNMNTSGGPDEAKRGGASGHPRAATGDLALGDIGDIVGKAKDAAASGTNDSPLTPGDVNLPGPAPSLEETKQAVKDVASGGGGLKAAVASHGANISRTGDAMPDGLKPGQYQPS